MIVREDADELRDLNDAQKQLRLRPSRVLGPGQGRSGNAGASLSERQPRGSSMINEPKGPNGVQKLAPQNSSWWSSWKEPGKGQEPRLKATTAGGSLPDATPPVGGGAPQGGAGDQNGAARAGSTMAGKPAGSFRSQGQRLAASLLKQKRQDMLHQAYNDMATVSAAAAAERAMPRQPRPAAQAPARLAEGAAPSTTPAGNSAAADALFEKFVFSGAPKREGGPPRSAAAADFKAPRKVGGSSPPQRPDTKKSSPKAGQAKNVQEAADQGGRAACSSNQKAGSPEADQSTANVSRFFKSGSGGKPNSIADGVKASKQPDEGRLQDRQSARPKPDASPVQGGGIQVKSSLEEDGAGPAEDEKPAKKQRKVLIDAESDEDEGTGQQRPSAAEPAAEQSTRKREVLIGAGRRQGAGAAETNKRKRIVSLDGEEDAGKEALGSRPREATVAEAKAKARQFFVNRPVRKPAAKDEDEFETLVDDDEEEDGTGSMSWRPRDAERDDPVVVALRKCEEIACNLSKQLREGVSSGEKPNADAGISESEGDRANEGQGAWMSMVDASGAKLVTQDDVSAACGRTIGLKPYQLVGVNFLVLLQRQGVGGAILADEMGLGKTVQAICFLALRAYLEGDKGPHLVVAPASLLENWQRELKRWCPKLKVVMLHGSERAAVRQELEHAMRRKKTGKWEREVRGGGAGADEPDKNELELPFNVMLTCYSLFERDSQAQKDDRKFLRKFDFSCVLMDEAHLLKDRSSQRTTRLRKVTSNAKHRLMLTGTPLQNDLQELWSLLELLHPSIFGSEGNENILSEYLSRDEGAESELIGRMKTILAPFVLRRVKADVMRQLSPKIQKVELLEMAQDQAAMYKVAVDQYRVELRQKQESGTSTRKRKGAGAEAKQEEAGPAGKEGGTGDKQVNVASLPKKQIASIFTHLRKIANHPLLVRHRYTDEVVKEIAPVLRKAGAFGDECTVARVEEELLGYSDFDLHQLCLAHCERKPVLKDHVLPEEKFLDSGKCQALGSILPQLQKEGHRVLIFSQWTSVLDILEHVLDILGLAFVRLDGSTQVVERQELVDQFNGDTNIFAFLLSTRAGGQGLNLTGADTVILHDVDFNPQMDRQAEDRAHRIGQTKPVTIIRLVAKGTVDQNILSIAERKLSLDAALLESGGKAQGPAGEEATSMAAILSSLFADASNAA